MSQLLRPVLRAGCTLALVGITLTIASARQKPDQPIFRSATAAVTLDVVVRDRTGQPVTGLTIDDFEVVEDGVPQKIVRLDAGDSGVPAPPAAPRMSPRVEGDGTLSLVALIFEQMSHQGRKPASDAARSLVEALQSDEFLGVFSMDLRATMAAAFTQDRDEIRRALDVILETPSVSPMTTAMTGVAETNGPVGPDRTQGGGARDAMTARLSTPSEVEHFGGAQAASLMDAISRLSRFPGRRSIVLFSEGLFVSPRLEGVIARALAENVAVYAINASGLGASRRVVPVDHKIDRRELTSSSRRGKESWRYGFLEMDPTRGLGPLAGHTGGFLVANTNDLTKALASITADRRSYYLLGYSSSNPVLDGSTRQIEVRVKRQGLSVRARTGYVAAPAAGQ